MNYPVTTPLQLRAVLRALRQSRNLSQAEVGELLGVNQKRVARIENAPGVTSFDQISRLVAALSPKHLKGIGRPLIMPKSATLAIWMNGIRVGTWAQIRGTHVLQYDPAW